MKFWVSIGLALCIADGSVRGQAPVTAQHRPDFSGVWVIDASRNDLRSVYGQMRVVTQTTAAVHVTVVQLNGFTGSVTTIPWQYRFGRWSPRRGGEQSKEPLTRAQWDGSTLVTVKAPGTHYSVLQAWRLAAGGREMVVQGISKDVGFDFDFRVAIIPRLYFGEEHVYVRVPDAAICPDCAFAFQRDGVRWGASSNESPFLFTFQNDASALRVTCLVAECAATDIVRGRRTSSRLLSEGRTITVPLSSMTAIETVKKVPR
jgi:hypothetical protein